jgi:hypothetical protein
MARMASWRTEFGGYRYPVTEARIDRWLDQFQNADRDLAARVLDCVDFIAHEQMGEAFRSILNGLPGWHQLEEQRQGKWRFVAFSTSAGESGDAMLRLFRHANNLAGKQFNELFIYKSELLSENLGSEDTVVFVDDFSGTGDQVCEAWTNSLRELLPEGPSVFLILMSASAAARTRIETETKLVVNCYIELSASENIFSPKCKHFTPLEKRTLLTYCERADRNNPQGRGSCGLVIVFWHTCPNNSIPILHVRKRGWEGLFRRYD